MLVVVMICAAVFVALAVCGQMQSEEYAARRKRQSFAKDTPQRHAPEDSFSFALTWNCYGVSSYDSLSGILIKEDDTDHTHDFTARLFPDEHRMRAIRTQIEALDVDSYPEVLADEVICQPPGVLNLTVRRDGAEKSIVCLGLYPESEASDPMLRRYLDTCGAIIAILTSTDEWRSLPDWEKYYD